MDERDFFKNVGNSHWRHQHTSLKKKKAYNNRNKGEQFQMHT